MSTTERRIGRYVLAEPIGWGAMGTVYRAEDPLIHRTVAVKVLHAIKVSSPEQVATARKRFMREAQAAGGIDHPNVIRILDIGEDGDSGEMYIVMEHVSGPSLEKLLHETGIELARAMEIIGQIASGLDAAHARGIIHRDIKPSNVLLTQEGTAKIVDFGITHVVSSSLTQDMAGVGTPAYMSPEQVSGSNLDRRADLFSLGVLSYEILSGTKPFKGTDAVSIAYAIAHSQPQPISAANARLPQALDRVMARMLAKKPAERFASGREFQEAVLSALSQTDEIHASVPAKLARGRSLALWALGGAATLVAVGVLVSSAGDKTTTPPPRSRESVSQPARPSPPVPTASLTISLAHRVRHGTLMVSLDGVPIFTESFSTAKLALFQTTTWDPVKAPAGEHKLRAKVTGDNGKTYLSDAYPIELSRSKATALRISFQGNTLAFKRS